MSYYNTCTIPKPSTAKKTKLANGFKSKPARICHYCGTAGAERHEVYGGNPNRQTSIKHGFQVDLCPDCHREMEENITNQAQERNEYWQKYYQDRYESKLIDTGVSREQARELWMLLIGRNYL